MSSDVPKKGCGTPNGLVLIDQNYIAKRLAHCKCCEFASGDTCELIEETNPGKSSIKRGITNKKHSCPHPIQKWKEEPMNCPNCGRANQVIKSGVGMCWICVEKKKLSYQPGTFYNRKPMEPLPFADPVLNLHYFIYPRYEASTRYHLDRLRKSINTFNGQRICCVATDGNTIEKSIADELDELFSYVYYVQNDPRKREGIGFLSSLKMLETNDTNEAICFAHAKGQQVHTEQAEIIRKWSDAMYETVVDNWRGAKQAMENGFPIAGSFKSLGTFRSTSFKWHYSGSFWWARSARLFENPHWRKTCRQWWLSESYVGRHWTETEGYCLFGDRIGHGSLYHHATWEDRIDKELIKWRSKHAVAA